MKEWKCIRFSAASENWTLFKVYREDKRGNLIDDRGNVRLSALKYNCRASKEDWTTLFEEVLYPTSLENK